MSVLVMSEPVSVSEDVYFLLGLRPMSAFTSFTLRFDCKRSKKQVVQLR